MSDERASDAAKLAEWANFSPTPAAEKGTLKKAGKPGRKPKAEKMTQLNLRVPEEMKRQVQIVAMRDERDMSGVIIEAFRLYQEKYGKAPTLTPTEVS